MYNVVRGDAGAAAAAGACACANCQYIIKIYFHFCNIFSIFFKVLAENLNPPH